MTGRRLLRVLAASAAATVPASHTALAQIATLSSNSWFGASCAGIACSQGNVTVGFVPVGGEFLVGQSFTNRGAFADGCPACKDNNRPFFVPPGILMRVSDGVASRQFGLGLGRAEGQAGGVDNDHAASVDDQTRDDDSHTPGTNQGTLSSSGTSSAGQILSSGVIAATPLVATTAVTINPEPSTVLLIATGLFGLVPIIGRRRRR
jgi:hypothetical protein